jgi:hypothetical protein
VHYLQWIAADINRQTRFTMQNGNRTAQQSLSLRFPSWSHQIMKTPLAIFAAVAALTLAAPSADAKGCIKGAVVGGVAGHYAGHHGVLGAAAGCLYGRHRAKEQAKQQTQGAPPAAQDKM